MVPRARLRLGVAFVLAGIVLVLVGVLRILNAAEGDRPATTFAKRRSYDQVKVAVHEELPVSAAYAAAGLLLVITGGRLVGSARRALAETERGPDPLGQGPDS